MGTGIVFTYLLIAAVAAPLLWLAWWGAGSLGGTRRAGRAVPVRLETPARRHGFDRPYPADIGLIGQRARIAIYDTAGVQVETCKGPDSAGKCPRPLADGSVPCAGCLLALPASIQGSRQWHIPSGYQACLVGSYAAYRQTDPAV